MNKLPLLAAILLAVSPQAGGARAEPVPASDAQVATFLSVLPDRAVLGKVSEPDPQMMGRLNALNPGKDAQVRAILEKFESCLTPAIADATLRMIEGVARGLGQAKLQRMIEFYRNEPPATMALIDRLRGPSPSAADRAEGDRLLAAYPIEEFSKAFRAARSNAALRRDMDFAAAASRCREAKRVALAQAGLKGE